MKHTEEAGDGVPSAVLKEVQQVRQFYMRLCIYVGVMAWLLLVNMIVTPHILWVVFPALGWGLGILFNWMSVFTPIALFGDAWMEKEIQKRMKKKGLSIT